MAGYRLPRSLDMNLNLPTAEVLAGCKNLLIAGMGGGFDLFCGLPVYFELQRRGQTAHLANFSFSDVRGYTAGTRLTDTLMGVDADYDDYVVYFSELFLSQWFTEKRKENTTIWYFHKTGTEPLLKNERAWVDHLHIDGILLIDGGVDSLIRGDEGQTATLIEDATSLFVINELKTIPVRIVGCIGLGAERDLAYPQIFENIASLTKDGGFLGSCSGRSQSIPVTAAGNAHLYGNRVCSHIGEAADEDTEELQGLSTMTCDMQPGG